MEKHWDVIIIGGGLAGFVAANILAKENLSILVLEKNKRVGGRAKTDRINGQLFNIGPHALYRKGKAKLILEQLGIVLNGRSPKLGGVLIESDFQHVAPFNPMGVFTTSYFRWVDRLQWLKALILIKKIKEDSLSQQTFLQWVEQTSSSKAVQKILLLLGRLATYCHAPEQVSAKVIVSQLKSVMNGVLYLDGGWQTMIDQLHNKAILLNVDIRSYQTVKKITPIHTEEESTFKLSLVNGETLYAKNILSTTSPQDLLKMIEDAATPQMVDTFSQKIPVKGASLDVALTQLPDPTKLFALDIDTPLYYSVHSTYARLSNEANNVILHVFKYLQPGEKPDSIAVKQELEQFLGKIQPGWKQYEITNRFIPNITVNERLPLLGDEERLQASKYAIPGLYIAGDWASPDSVLSEAAVTSAHEAANTIIQKETGNNFAN